MVVPRPTARIRRAAKLEFSSNPRSKKPEAGQSFQNWSLTDAFEIPTVRDVNLKPIQPVLSDALPIGEKKQLTYYAGKGLDVRTVSGEFLLSLQKLWREQGDDILRRVAAQYPELIFISQVKLAKVMRVEIGSPGDFTRLGNKQEIIEKLERKAGPEARKLFEKFIKDVEKLQAQQEQETC